jgi:hypothetical protein
MFIELGNIKFQHLIIIIFPTIVQIQQLLVIDEKERIDNTFFYCFSDYIGMIFCGIIHLISKNLIKTEKQQEGQNKVKPKIELEAVDSKNTNQGLNIYQSMELEEIKKQKKNEETNFYLLY